MFGHGVHNFAYNIVKELFIYFYILKYNHFVQSSLRLYGIDRLNSLKSC